MTHPTETTLALYAGHDLGPIARWRTRRHLSRCEQCRAEVDAFSEVREEVAGDDDLGGIAWNRLAAEMKANIRVGLAAGECIREAGPLPPMFAGARAAAACVSVAVLLVAGLWIERPAPPHRTQAHAAGISLRATAGGIELRQGDQAFVLKNGSANVTYSAGAQGSIGARYVDPGTGYVTINTVYVQ